MDPDAPLGAQASKQSTSDSVRNWVASFLSYLELRLRLLGLESKEAGLHLLVLALLLVGAVVFFAGFLVMLLVFLLYLLTLFSTGDGVGARSPVAGYLFCWPSPPASSFGFGSLDLCFQPHSPSLKGIVNG